MTENAYIAALALLAALFNVIAAIGGSIISAFIAVALAWMGGHHWARRDE